MQEFGQRIRDEAEKALSQQKERGVLPAPCRRQDAFLGRRILPVRAKPGSGWFPETAHRLFIAGGTPHHSAPWVAKPEFAFPRDRITPVAPPNNPAPGTETFPAPPVYRHSPPAGEGAHPRYPIPERRKGRPRQYREAFARQKSSRTRLYHAQLGLFALRHRRTPFLLPHKGDGRGIWTFRVSSPMELAACQPLCWRLPCCTIAIHPFRNNARAGRPGHGSGRPRLCAAVIDLRRSYIASMHR